MQTRLQECIEMRKMIQHTDLMHKGSDIYNENIIKNAMNNFVKDGTPCTLRLWADPNRRVRVVLVLTNNTDRQSGMTVEKP